MLEKLAEAKAGNTLADALKKTAEDLSLANMAFWRQLASSLVKDEVDPWRIGEIATLLEEFSRNLAAEWGGISRSVDAEEMSRLGVSVGFTIDRSDAVPGIKFKISYSRKWGRDSNVEVPNPDQDELPFTADGNPEDATNESLTSKDLGGEAPQSYSAPDDEDPSEPNEEGIGAGGSMTAHQPEE